MGKTIRRSKLDQNYGCFEGYIERRAHRYGNNAGLNDNDPMTAWYADWDKRYWARRTRDGRSSEYHHYSGGRGARGHYRFLTNQMIRNDTKRAIARARQDGDWDNAVFPTARDGKRFIWSVW
jgi:hypothetical protein